MISVGTGGDGVDGIVFRIRIESAVVCDMLPSQKFVFMYGVARCQRFRFPDVIKTKWRHVELRLEHMREASYVRPVCGVR